MRLLWGEANPSCVGGEIRLEADACFALSTYDVARFCFQEFSSNESNPLDREADAGTYAAWFPPRSLLSKEVVGPEDI